MARIVSPEELKPKAPTPPPPADPLRTANDSIERLAKIVMHVAQLPPPQINIPPAPAPVAPQARPKRIEASIKRDSAGKMESVILTPIY